MLVGKRRRKRREKGITLRGRRGQLVLLSTDGRAICGWRRQRLVVELVAGRKSVVERKEFAVATLDVRVDGWWSCRRL